MAIVKKAVGGLGNASDEDVLEGVTYTSDNGIKRTGVAKAAPEILIDETLTKYGQAADAGVVGSRLNELDEKCTPDDTLSIQGKAADAGITGDEFKRIINSLGEICETNNLITGYTTYYENTYPSKCTNPIILEPNKEYDFIGNTSMTGHIVDDSNNELSVIYNDSNGVVHIDSESVVRKIVFTNRSSSDRTEKSLLWVIESTDRKDYIPSFRFRKDIYPMQNRDSIGFFDVYVGSAVDKPQYTSIVKAYQYDGDADTYLYVDMMDSRNCCVSNTYIGDNTIPYIVGVEADSTTVYPIPLNTIIGWLGLSNYATKSKINLQDFEYTNTIPGTENLKVYKLQYFEDLKTVDDVLSGFTFRYEYLIFNSGPPEHIVCDSLIESCCYEDYGGQVIFGNDDIGITFINNISELYSYNNIHDFSATPGYDGASYLYVIVPNYEIAEFTIEFDIKTASINKRIETLEENIPIVPETLPNPNKLIFTGAVTGEYDGSTEETIAIPTIAGPTGPKGEKGEPGPSGADGVSVTHSWNGTELTLTSASGTTTTDLKGPKGDTGEKGEVGQNGADGPKGDKGDPFVYSDFTQEQLDSLKGPKGDPGETGIQGPKGDPFVYSDFTQEQLDSLKGPKGDTGETGKNAYQYATDNGYTGTEADFSAKMAAKCVTGIQLNGTDLTVDENGKVNIKVSSYYTGTTVPTADIGNDDDIYIVK